MVDMEPERNDRLGTVHTSADSGDVYKNYKNYSVNSFQYRDSGFTEEEEDEYDDTKFVKSRVSGFSRGVLEVRTILLAICIARYQFVSNFL